MNTIELLLGPNWRTTVSGWTFNIGAVIVALSVLPKETWQDPKITIPAVLGVLAKFIQDWHAKDKQVSGNGTLNNPFKVNAGDGSNRTLIPAFTAITLAVVLGMSLGACAFLQAQQRNLAAFDASAAGKQTLSNVEHAVTDVAADVLLNLAEQYATSGKINAAQVGVAAVQGASFQLRSMEGTPQASDPAAILTAMAQGSASHPAIIQSVAPAVANAIVTAIQSGAPPSLALESAAAGLDQSVNVAASNP